MRVGVACVAEFAKIKDTALYRARQPRVHEVLGEIALTEKRLDDAIAEFRRGDVDADGSPVDEDPTRIHFELYDMKGDRERAISHLSRFVELWKNADPELQPVVAEAKRHLAKLQAGGKGRR